MKMEILVIGKVERTVSVEGDCTKDVVANAKKESSALTGGDLTTAKTAYEYYVKEIDPKLMNELKSVSNYLSKCPCAEYTQIDEVYDDGDVFVLTVGMAIRKDDLEKDAS